MIDVRQGRAIWIAPSFSIEMQTKHKIRMQFEIYKRGTASNLAVAVKQNFALPTDGLLFGRISRVKNIGAWLRHAVLDQNFLCEVPKIIRALRRGRFIVISHKRNVCSEFTQSRCQQSRHVQSKIAFLNWLALSYPKPTFLHLRPFSAEMTGIKSDF